MLLEAAVIGLPIIATKLAGIPDIVKEGVNGHLMPYESNAWDWAEKIKSLLHDDNKLREFGKQSRLLAESEFSSAAFKAKVLKAFHIAGILQR